MMARAQSAAALLLAFSCMAQAAAQEPAPAPAATPAAASVPAPAPAAEPAPAPAAPAVVVPELPPLHVFDVKLGKGAEAVDGKTVQVQYTGWLFDDKAKSKRGKQFDTSRQKGRTALEFILGSGRVIKGWDQGVAGMKVGGKRTLVIPSHMAYGERGAGKDVIPPNATLVFDVELVGVK
jgi:FKBP-type peptidyl-prolyl cis-trans isomerase FkpA